MMLLVRDCGAVESEFHALNGACHGAGRASGGLQYTVITMGRQVKRWPIWRIAAATVACAVVSPALFWLAAYADRAVDDQTGDPITPTPVLTVSSFVIMLAMIALMLAVLGAVWLVVRIRDARTPAWKKQAKKTRFADLTPGRKGSGPARRRVTKAREPSDKRPESKHHH